MLFVVLLKTTFLEYSDFSYPEDTTNRLISPSQMQLPHIAWQPPGISPACLYRDDHHCYIITEVFKDCTLTQVWDYLSGVCMKVLSGATVATEVTGMLHLLHRSQFLSVGWNRRITTFMDEPDERVMVESDSGDMRGSNEERVTYHCKPCMNGVQ